MPDRIIKESSCTSDTLNQLSDFEERFWWRLTVNCDDYGRCDARPAILKSKLFPLADGKTHKDMEKALTALASVGLVKVYQVDGRPFLQVVKWDKHQRIRAKRSKYPSPDDACCQMPSSDTECPRNPIQSESKSESNPNPNICAEPQGDSAPVAIIPLNTGEEFGVTQAQVDEWAALYPAVDVMQELRNMRGWCLGNPERRKTRRGVVRFIVGWLAREQDKGKQKTGMGRKTIGPAPKAADDRVASAVSLKKDSDWMDQFLAEQSGKGAKQNAD